MPTSDEQHGLNQHGGNQHGGRPGDDLAEDNPAEDNLSGGPPGEEDQHGTASGDTAPGDADNDQVTLAGLAREVEEFVGAAGWDQPAQLFALVRTAALLEMQPELAQQLDPSAPLTPIAQEPLPDGDLADALAGITWPETVLGCALAQEIIVLPPEAESDLPDAETAGTGGSEGYDEVDARRLRSAAADHPRRTEARLVAAVLRNGPAACALRLRGGVGEHGTDEVIEHPDLAPNLTAALHSTFDPD